jgi:transposase
MTHSALDLKHQRLEAQGCLNRHPLAVKDEQFGTDKRFFDPHDLIQVKYEMLRRVRCDKRPVSDAARHFGFSRVSFYQARDAFDKEGLPGLLPRKRGPKQRHKLSEEIVRFAMETRLRETSVTVAGLTERIAERFGVRVHPRSIQRALAAQKKKRPGAGRGQAA